MSSSEELLKKRGSGIIPFIEERYASAYYQMYLLNKKEPETTDEIIKWMLANREIDENRPLTDTFALENVFYKLKKYGIDAVLTPGQRSFIKRVTEEGKTKEKDEINVDIGIFGNETTDGY